MLTPIFAGIYAVLGIIYLVHSLKILHADFLRRNNVSEVEIVDVKRVERPKLSFKWKFFFINLTYAMICFVVILTHLVAQAVVVKSMPQFPTGLIYTLSVFGILPFLMLLFAVSSMFLYWLIFHSKRHVVEAKANIKFHNVKTTNEALVSKLAIEEKVKDQQELTKNLLNQQIANAQEQKLLEAKQEELESHLPKKTSVILGEMIYKGFEKKFSKGNVENSKKSNPKKGGKK